MRPALLALVLSVAAGSAEAQGKPPTKIGSCVQGTIKSISTRFGDKLVKPNGDDIDQGASFQATSGIYGVSYSYVPELAASRVGDRVLSCLTSIPKGCPKGDDRGRMYTTTNMRTQASWTLPDSQHMCGGA